MLTKSHRNNRWSLVCHYSEYCITKLVFSSNKLVFHKKTVSADLLKYLSSRINKGFFMAIVELVVGPFLYETFNDIMLLRYPKYLPAIEYLYVE